MSPNPVTSVLLRGRRGDSYTKGKSLKEAGAGVIEPQAREATRNLEEVKEDSPLEP